MTDQNDEVTDPRVSVLPEALPPSSLEDVTATSPIDDVPSGKARVASALSTALIACGALAAGREAALVRTKIDEAALWLSRCAD